jgi:competence protein ComEA
MTQMLRKAGVVLLAALAAASAHAVDANTANRAQLEQLRHVGPPLADALLVAREKGGPFKGWADLMARVKGIRAARAARLSEAGLTVDGAPYLPPIPSSSISK